jgi:hypothetical protein
MNAASSQNPAPSALFASVRASRDLSLSAFVGAVLTAFALTAGAFVPRMSPPAAPPAQAPAIQPASPAPAAVVASQPVPCELPRG